MAAANAADPRGPLPGCSVVVLASTSPALVSLLVVLGALVFVFVFVGACVRIRSRNRARARMCVSYGLCGRRRHLNPNFKVRPSTLHAPPPTPQARR